MYDVELKEKYIKDSIIAYSSATRNVQRWLFREIDKYETLLNKSLLDMSLLELKGFLAELNCKSASTMDTAFSLLKNYVFSCSDNTKSAFIALSTMNRKDFINLIDKHANYGRNITQSEYESYCQSEIGNFQDKALLIFLWHGICGEEYTDIVELKKWQFNFNNKTLTLNNGDIIEFTDAENEILKKACYEEYYERYNDDDEVISKNPLLSGDYFIKQGQSKRVPDREDNQITTTALRKRFLYFFKAIGASYLNGRSVYLSGVLNRYFKDTDYLYTTTPEAFKVINKTTKISYNKLTEMKSIIEQKLIEEGYVGLINPQDLTKSKE